MDTGFSGFAVVKLDADGSFLWYFEVSLMLEPSLGLGICTVASTSLSRLLLYESDSQLFYRRAGFARRLAPRNHASRPSRRECDLQS